MAKPDGMATSGFPINSDLISGSKDALTQWLWGFLPRGTSY